MRLADVVLANEGRALVARLTGEVDMSNAEGIGETLTEAMPNSSLALVLDLSRVDYLDSAGIHLIYRLRERLRARGQSLKLVIPAMSPANDALRLAGVLRHVDTSETSEEALASVG